MNKTKLLICGVLLAMSCTAAFAEDHPAGAEGINKDRDITRAEHAKRADEHFTKMDTNADGTLSKDERKAAHEKMREHRQERHKNKQGQRPGDAPTAPPPK